jgi:hypothetical protein
MTISHRLRWSHLCFWQTPGPMLAARDTGDVRAVRPTARSAALPSDISGRRRRVGTRK